MCKLLNLPDPRLPHLGKGMSLRVAAGMGADVCANVKVNAWHAVGICIQ